MNNITYIFGAGASFNACPILNEMGEKMMDLSKVLGFNHKYSDNELSINRNIIEAIAWEIGCIGKKSIEFNTIDTYAKKLFLLQKHSELTDLKKAVSVFFTLWALTSNSKWKKIENNGAKRECVEIDPRYISLLATYLVKGERYPRLDDNVKFITWNYDLQLELAYSKFTDIKPYFLDVIDKFFPFKPISSNIDLNVCHLNGFHGIYGREDAHNLYDLAKHKDLTKLLDNIDFLYEPHFKGETSFDQFINYAWETNSEISALARNKAKQILSKTNILVIIGYSFPPFNHDIDNELINSCKKNLKRVIIQDPKANAQFFSETFDVDLKKVSVVNENMNQFVIPYYAEKASTSAVKVFAT